MVVIITESADPIVFGIISALFFNRLFRWSVFKTGRELREKCLPQFAEENGRAERWTGFLLCRIYERERARNVCEIFFTKQ